MNIHITAPRSARSRVALGLVGGVAAAALLTGCQTAAQTGDQPTVVAPVAVRPAYIAEITPADRAERLIEAEAQRGADQVESVPGPPADRLDRDFIK